MGIIILIFVSFIDLLLLTYHTIEMYLFEISFSMPPSSLTHLPALQRTDVLFMCHNATKAYFRHYFSLQAKPYLIHSRVVVGQTYFAMMMLSKFSLFNAEDWNPNDVETSMNLSAVVDRVTMMMEEMSAKFDHSVDKKPWLHLSQRIRQIGVRFDRLVANENRSLPLPAPVVQREGPLISQSDQFAFNQFDLLDDSFWQTLSDNTSNAT